MFVHKFIISSVIITHNDKDSQISALSAEHGPQSYLLVKVNSHTLSMDETSEGNYVGVSLSVVYLSSE